MDGVLVIDKPVGPTSHDIVARARRALDEARIGHAGTLDPAASGVLLLVMGKATRLVRFLSAGDKSYQAVIRLGFSTDTGDAEGAPLGAEYGGAWPTRERIDAALDLFRGRFLQQPPVYSAKKIDGHRSYRLAREAAVRVLQATPDAPEPVPSRLPAPVEVATRSLVVLGVEASRVILQVECSAGFYVRSLAHDLGERLGTGAHLAGLRRTRSGDYELTQSVPIEAIERDRRAAEVGFVPLASMLPRLSFVVLTPEGIEHARHGRGLGATDLASKRMAEDEVPPIHTQPGSGDDAWIRLLAPEGELVGLARRVSDSGLLHPSVVLI